LKKEAESVKLENNIESKESGNDDARSEFMEHIDENAVDTGIKEEYLCSYQSSATKIQRHKKR